MTSLVLALTGCTALLLGGGSGGDQASARSSAQVAIDRRITAAVRNKLDTDPVLSQYDLSVQTYDNTVTLRGSVGSRDARERAVLLTRAIDGVDHVDNRVRVEGR